MSHIKLKKKKYRKIKTGKRRGDRRNSIYLYRDKKYWFNTG